MDYYLQLARSDALEVGTAEKDRPLAESPMVNFLVADLRRYSISRALPEG